jgi:hypothetical protein
VSRVEDQQKKQADVERLQQQQDRTSRDAQKSDQSRRRFGELVKQGAGRQQLQESATKKGADDKQAESVQGSVLRDAQTTAREARLARGGVLQHKHLMDKAKSFEGTLKAHQQDTKETHKGRVEQREEGLGKTREAVSERVADLESKHEVRAEREKESQREEVKAEGRVNASIDGSGKKGQSGGDAGAGSGGQGQPQPQGLAAAQGAAGPEGPREVQQIPEEILKALAQEVYVGVNERGLMEFRVELKEGILQGATLKVDAKDGKIQLRFEGLEGHAKNLVSASEGELARRLEAKGLRLDALVV